MEKLTLTTALAALGLFLSKTLFDIFRNNQKELTVAINELKLSVVRLTIKLDLLERRLDQLASLEKDVNAIGHKLRSLQETS